jgi:monoamine oxidase
VSQVGLEKNVLGPAMASLSGVSRNRAMAVRIESDLPDYSIYPSFQISLDYRGLCRKIIPGVPEGGMMRRSYHSRLTAMLREARAACHEAAARGMPIDEVTQRRAEYALSRRAFLLGSGAVILPGAAPHRPSPPRARPAPVRPAKTQPRIVIVGAGLAGIRCAHKLWTERGIRSTVFEADGRPGGRVETYRFPNGQIAEQHGEFLSSEHASTLALVRRYDLPLDLAGVYPGGGQDTYWFRGARYSQAQLNTDWQNFGRSVFAKAARQAPWPTRLDRSTAVGFQWDHMSVADWINRHVPGGLNSQFGALCYQDAISEYGGPPEDQSALNLVYLLGYDDSTESGAQPQAAPALSGTDEAYHIQGGNEQLVARMVEEAVPGVAFNYGYRLVALKLGADRSYTCTFLSAGGGATAVPADHVVLAIPFTTLRQVDLTRAGFSALKMRAIHTLPLGTSAKLHLQFAGRPWNALGYDGNAYADTNHVLWECTNYQRGSTGILNDLSGGSQIPALVQRYGLTPGKYDGTPPQAWVNDTLAALGTIFSPGISQVPVVQAYASVGYLNPNLLGAWSYYATGNYTGFSGIEPVRQGNVHFAGEQTSLDFQGFMEGAVTSGERVVDELFGSASLGPSSASAPGADAPVANASPGVPQRRRAAPLSRYSTEMHLSPVQRPSAATPGGSSTSTPSRGPAAGRLGPSRLPGQLPPFGAARQDPFSAEALPAPPDGEGTPPPTIPGNGSKNNAPPRRKSGGRSRREKPPGRLEQEKN